MQATATTSTTLEHRHTVWLDVLLAETEYGRLLLALENAQSASDRAKTAINETYINRLADDQIEGARKCNSESYAKKNNAIHEACILARNTKTGFGWGNDPQCFSYPRVVYFDLPTGQVSFHTPSRGDGPDYGGQWDGKDASHYRIYQAIADAKRPLLDNSTREGVEACLKLFRVSNFTINPDLTVDVRGDVNLHAQKLEEIPVQFGVVTGKFDCSHNMLSSLKGSPQKVGEFDGWQNCLKSLEGAPKKVKIPPSKMPLSTIIPDSRWQPQRYEHGLIVDALIHQRWEELTMAQVNNPRIVKLCKQFPMLKECTTAFFDQLNVSQPETRDGVDTPKPKLDPRKLIIRAADMPPMGRSQ